MRPPTLLRHLLEDSSESYPEKPAAIFPHGRELSYRELDDLSSRLAARLRVEGIGSTDRVAIVWENSPSALIAFWAVQKIGAATVDLPTQAAAHQLAVVFDEVRPVAILASARQLPHLRGCGLDRGFPELAFSEEGSGVDSARTLEVIFAEEGEAFDESDSTPDDVAMIVYTSGTTGRPKGIMLSHGNLLSNITAANSLVKLDSDERILVVVPLHYIHGRMQLLTHALIGGTLVFSAGFVMPQVVLHELQEHRVTALSGVPYHFKTLLRRTSLKDTKLPELRYVLITGGALNPAEMRELGEALPGVGIHTAYGLTEASPRITYMSPYDIRRRPTSCGRALPGVLVEILDDAGQTLPSGEIGEIAASGPNIMGGYVSGDERESGRIDDRGRLRTGDLGWLDDGGYLHLEGRKSEMIKSAGERIFPGEIEAVIRSLATVAEVVVFGMPDPDLGEKVAAHVVPRDAALPPTVEEIHSHCLASMSFVRVPRLIRVVAGLPMTPSGKPDRVAVREVENSREGGDG